MNYWHNQHVTGIVGVNLPDERNSGSGGSFQAVEASARALPSDGHLVVQANGTVSAIPDYPTLVKTITDWYHAAALGNPSLKCTVVLPEVLGYDVRAIASGPHDGTPIRIFGIVSDYHDDLVRKVNEIRVEHGLGLCELEGLEDTNAAPVTASVNSHGRLRCVAQGPFPTYAEVVVSGVFDHLNNADKALLMVSAMVTEKCLFVGLADGPAMLKDVPFKEFIQSYNDRLAAIQSFLTLVKPDIRVQVTPMFTTLGPGVEEKNAECIVLEQNDISVGAAVNVKRTERRWEVVDTLSIDLAYYPEGKPDDEDPESLYEDDFAYGEARHEKPIVRIDSSMQRTAEAEGWVSPARLDEYI